MCVRAQRTHSKLYRAQTQTHNSTYTNTHTHIYTHTEPHSNSHTQAHADRTNRSQIRRQRKEGSSKSKEAVTARGQLPRMAQRPRCHSLTYEAALSHLSHTLRMSAKVTECARAGRPLTHTPHTDTSSNTHINTHTHTHTNTKTLPYARTH